MGWRMVLISRAQMCVSVLGNAVAISVLAYGHSRPERQIGALSSWHLWQGDRAYVLIVRPGRFAGFFSEDRGDGARLRQALREFSDSTIVRNPTRCGLYWLLDRQVSIIKVRAWLGSCIIAAFVNYSLVASFVRVRGRRARDQCAACAYDLRLLESTRCPECGRPIDERLKRGANRRRDGLAGQRR